MNEKQSLLEDANAKKKQPPITKESPIGFRQLVSVLFIHTLVLVLCKSSSVMSIALIISYYSSACVLL